MSWVRVGVKVDDGIPRDRLTEEELREFRGMITERERMLAQARLIEERMQLVLLLARDRRGLRGSVQADPETGMIRCGEVDDV